MSILDHCKIHTYRNTNSMISFDVSDEFVFIVSNSSMTENEDSLERFYIYQYINNTTSRDITNPIEYNQIIGDNPMTGDNQMIEDNSLMLYAYKCKYYENLPITSPLKTEIPFKPVFSCFNNGKFILASKNELFYFKYSLFNIGNINPLSMTFFYEDLLVSVDCNNMTIYNTEYNTNLIINLTIINNNIENNGICSAYCIFDCQLYLGFEDGSIGVIPITAINKKYKDTNRIEMEILECFKDPILTIIVDEFFIFVHTLTGIFRITRKNNNRDTYKDVYTKIRAVKMLQYKSSLILFDKNELIFMDFNLKIKKIYPSTFEIKDCKIKQQDSMFVGFKNGLLVEFSLSKILST